MTTNTNDATRDRVSRDYANALSAAGAESCCGGAAEPGGIAAKLGGYETADLSALPEDAVVNAFGCGNPVALAGVEEGQTVLDLGSGAGIDILLAARKVGPTGAVIGVDMTEEMLARARENIAASGLENVEVRTGIIEEMPVADGTVDWVISNCVINLSPEKERVFAEIHRVLKPGGRFMISDIVVEHLPDWLRADQALYSGCVAGAISEAAYLQGLRDAGLVDVEVTERVVYDAAQLTAFAGVKPDADASGDACSCCCGGTEADGAAGASSLLTDPERARQAADEMAGNVWSAMFVGRKPIA